MIIEKIIFKKYYVGVKIEVASGWKILGDPSNFATCSGCENMTKSAL